MTTRVEKIQAQHPEATVDDIEKGLAVAGDILEEVKTHRLSDQTVNYWENYYGDREALRELIDSEGKYLQVSADPEDKIKYDAMVTAFQAQAALLDMEANGVALNDKLTELSGSEDAVVYHRIDELEGKGTLRAFDADQLEILIKEGIGDPDVIGEIQRQRTGFSYDYQQGLADAASESGLDVKLLNSCVVSEGRARGYDIQFTRPVLAAREQTHLLEQDHGPSISDQGQEQGLGH